MSLLGENAAKISMTLDFRFASENPCSNPDLKKLKSTREMD
jgi:hypothetical protein